MSVNKAPAFPGGGGVCAASAEGEGVIPEAHLIRSHTNTHTEREMLKPTVQGVRDIIEFMIHLALTFWGTPMLSIFI